MNEELILFKAEIIKKKLKCFKEKKFEAASNWRYVENCLIQFIDGDITFKLFLDFLKSQEFNNFDEICKVIKKLERKYKIIKIRKTS